MVKSEQELKRFTKRQLMEWLNKHDQRLPVDERLKAYYVERATKLFQQLQKENDGFSVNQPAASSRSKAKSKSKLRGGRAAPSIKAKTKRKANANSSTSSSASGRSRPLVRTQRRHSNVGLSPSQNLSRSSSPAERLRSRKRVIKVPRQSPGKRNASPSLTKALQKKRERVRRVTADPTNLEKAANESALLRTEQLPSSSDEDSDQVDTVDEELEQERSNNLMKRKFVLAQDPEKMTIGRMQDWLDANNIEFDLGQRKAYYIHTVREHALPRQPKRVLSPNHKKTHSPSNKKPKASVSPFDSPPRAAKGSARAPLPPHITQSPMTPKDEREEKRQSRIAKGARASGYQMKKGLLTTPTLNKKGIQKIDTPSKLAMRDEIRNFLFSDDSSPMRPAGVGKEGDALTGDALTDPTPGGPDDDGQKLDFDVLNDILGDLRKDKAPAKPMAPARSSFDVDSISYPQRQSVSPATMAKEARASLESTQINTGKKKSRSRSMVANRTRPSPTMSDDRDAVAEQEIALDRRNGNYPAPAAKVAKQWSSVPATPSMSDYANIGHGQSQAHYEEMVSVPKQRSAKRRQSFPQHTPATRNHLIDDEPMSPAIHAHSLEQQSRMTTARISNVLQREPLRESHGVVAPSMPKMQKPRMAQSAMDTTTKKKSGGICKILSRILMLGMVGAAIAVFFTQFDGMDRLNELADMAANFGVEEQVMFCDTGALTFQMADGSLNNACEPCPDHASVCNHGRVRCMTNYIFRAGRCVMDNRKIKYAYAMHSQISKILSERRGQFECGEMETAEDFGMRKDELLSHCQLADESKKEEAFAYFEEHILSEASTLSVKDGLYFSTKATKSKQCRVKEWALSNVLGLMATSVVLCVVVAIWRKQKRRRADQAEVERMLLGVYQVLEEYQKFTDHAHVPIDVVRQRVQPRSDELWQRVDAMIDSDAKIKRSLRMMDGMHKKCLQLTAMAQNGAGAAQHHFGGNLAGAQANSKQW